MLTMRLLWWQHLPLLILIQLVWPNSWTYGEAFLNFRSSFGGPQQFRCSIAKYPCQRQWHCLDCYQLKYPENQVNGPRKETVGATVGAVVAALIVIIIMVIFYICLMRVRRLAQTSETASSMPSPVELGMGNTCAPSCDAHKIRQLTILELEQATRNFSESNIIGGGRFGLVYKGLLQDGSIVALKRRLFALTQDFTHQVEQIARIHQHLVKLVGYYEDSHQQLLVYEYLHNGNVGNHLYDNDGLPIGKLNIRQRLSIALGASKGLEHLHGRDPPLLHTHFRTSNVLVDENFTAKVSDYGFCKLQNNADQAGSSNIDCFFDPELKFSQNFSEKSDVYNFGVFLFELTSGCEALYRNHSNCKENLVFQVSKNSKYLDKFLDITLRDHEKFAAMKIMELALLCLDVSFRRPSMRQIVAELEQIQQTEIAPLHSHKINVIAAVTLGSELFK
ncbi:hypothetical protein L6164_021971 [Bauhinia variegata]|uniref:Uncharacterized protein n=1 Tax=Bauhinia variegata TaxID=167791 RepID=A0ACB9MEP7_BAUVA|nr:hypothetical protein L6164_021971 [Bauhinia variegata]